MNPGNPSPRPRRPLFGLALAGLGLLLPVVASGFTILNANFDVVPAGSFADNAVITPDLTARVGTGTSLAVVDLGSGNRALDFTDNNTAFVGNGYPLAKAVFPGLATTGVTGNNQISGSFDLTRRQAGVAFNLLLQSGQQENSVSTSQLVHILVGGSGAVSYQNGGTSVATGVTLALDTAYRLTISVDLSSTTQDKWGFTVATAAVPTTLLVNLNNLNTRTPNLTPDIIVFSCGGDALGANASPAYRLDNAIFTAESRPGTTLWRIGQNNNSFSEFSTGSPPATYAVPADWATRTDWTGWKQVLYGTHNAVNVTFNLASLPAQGVEFSFRAMFGHIAVPQLAVHANGNPAGLIQVWGERGTTAQNQFQFRKIYRLYIPKELLVVGSNTLRLEIAPHPYEESNNNPSTGFNWDYLQLDALAAAANEPIHGSLFYLGTNILQKNVGTNDFIVDTNTVNNAETLLKWMGIAYSGNAMRAPYWSDVTRFQPARLALLQKYRDLNMRVVANHIHLPTAQNRLVGGQLAQADKTLVDNFLTSYGNLIQLFEVANEPDLLGGINKATVIAHTTYLKQVAAPHIQIAAPGWAYGGWEGVATERRSVEDLCDLIGGHSYGASFRDAVGGSFNENGRAQGPVLLDGYPKPFIATETGTNNFHADFAGTPTQTNASMFDRVLRGHVATATYALQHASHFKVDNSFEDFSLFAPFNWAGSSPDLQTAAPGIGGQDTRLKTFRRHALAYATHGRPLPYIYLTQPTNQRVLFRGVNTATLPAVPGSGATSNKVLLNFVNFEGVSRTIHVRVTMPGALTYAGDRIGDGTTYATARTAVSFTATPTLDFNITLQPREAVQYILGISTGDAANLADPDGDGLNNLLEFALGSDPTSAASAFSPSVSLDSANSTLRLDYSRSVAALSSVTYFPEWTDSLATQPIIWSSANLTTETLSDDGTLQQIRAYIPFSSSGSRFLRLRVVVP